MTKPKVFVCGCYGDYNIGDEAMLAGILQVLRPLVSKNQVTVFSKNPTDTTIRHLVDRTFPSPPPKRRLQAVWKTVENLPLVLLQHSHLILGGGDLLRDSTEYEVTQFWLKPLELAIRLNLKTAVLGVSTGELWKPKSLAKISHVLNQVNLISVRDQASKQKLIKIGVSQPIHIIPDLALQFWPLDDSSFFESRTTHQNPPQIGIAPRRITGRGQSYEGFDTEIHTKSLALAINKIIEKKGAFIHLLPFSTPQFVYGYEDDYVACLELARYIKYPENIKIYRYIPSFTELSKMLSLLDLMIGVRLHSLILAASLGLPVIALAYDLKVENFMKEILLSNSVIDVKASYSDELIQKIEDTLENWKNLSRLCLHGAASYCQHKNIVSEQVDFFLKS